MTLPLFPVLIILRVDFANGAAVMQDQFPTLSDSKVSLSQRIVTLTHATLR